MLVVDKMSIFYGGIQAVREVSLTVAEGEMVALIGPNGAGKSSLLNGISGIVRGCSGTVSLQGRPLQGCAAHQVARAGLIQVPEGRLVLGEQTVLENLLLGELALGKRARAQGLEQVFALFPLLRERQKQYAGSLSGGQQQMLAIGRALMGSPKVLLLDEPSLGLAPIVIEQVFGALQTLNRAGMTILLVEQNAKRALEVSNRAYVIERGRIVQQGASAAMRDDPVMMEHYLGAPLAQTTTMRREDLHA